VARLSSCCVIAEVSFFDGCVIGTNNVNKTRKEDTINHLYMYGAGFFWLRFARESSPCKVVFKNSWICTSPPPPKKNNATNEEVHGFRIHALG